MKKSVVLIVFAVYILSICIVGFFGVKMRVYDETIMVEAVKCDVNFTENATVKEETATSKNDYVKGLAAEGYEYYIQANYVAGKRLVLRLKFTVSPDNATEKGLDYLFDEKPESYTVTPDANSPNVVLVEFLKGDVLNITAVSKDASNSRTKVRVLVIEDIF